MVAFHLFLLSFLASAWMTVSYDLKIDVEDTSNVLVLGNDNFTSIVDPEPLMLVEFYAPWCGHCKKLAPEYELAAKKLIPENIKLAKMDCDDQTNKPLCNSFKIQGFPTLKIFRLGKPSDYNGGRTEETIVSFMKKQTLPALSDITGSNLVEFSKKDRIVVIIYLPKGRDDEHFAVLDELATAMREEVLFGLTHDKVAFKLMGLKDETKFGMILYRAFDDPTVQYPETTVELDALKKFIKQESLPTMDEVSPDNFMEYVNSGMPLAFFFYDSAEMRTKFGKGIEAVAHQYKNQIKFVYCDATKYGAHADALGLKSGSWPAFAINEVEANLKWPFDQSVDPTESAISGFVSKYINKTIQPTLKSQPIPEEQKGLVVEVVGKSFKDIVFDAKKDVMVKFYAPWCGHCKRLAPTWDELAAAFEPQKDKLSIVKMDLTENDPPAGSGPRVDGFPTLRMYRSGDNESIEYAGDRSIEDLVSFITKNAKNALDTPVIKKKDDVDEKQEGDDDDGSPEEEGIPHEDEEEEESPAPERVEL